MAEAFIYELVRSAHGEAVARRLAELFGGSEVSLPREATADNPIGRGCGLAVLQTLVAARGGEKVYIPLGPLSDARRKRAAVQADLAAGLDPAEICRRHRVARSTIWRQQRAAAMGQ